MSKFFRDTDEGNIGILTFSEMKRMLEHLLHDRLLTNPDVTQVMLFLDMKDLRVFDTETSRIYSEFHEHNIFRFEKKKKNV